AITRRAPSSRAVWRLLTPIPPTPTTTTASDVVTCPMFLTEPYPVETAQPINAAACGCSPTTGCTWNPSTVICEAREDTRANDRTGSPLHRNRSSGSYIVVAHAE